MGGILIIMLGLLLFLAFVGFAAVLIVTVGLHLAESEPRKKDHGVILTHFGGK